MWESHRKAFAKKHRIPYDDTPKYRCTAEHLQAVCQRGKTSRKNIAAACRECNELRGQKCPPLPPDEFRQRRQRRK